MLNNLGLSFGTIIALFIPGFVLFLSIIICYYQIDISNLTEIKESVPTSKEVSILSPFAISILSLTLGLILDSIRYLFAWLVQAMKGSKLDYSAFEEKDMKYHDWLIEHVYRFHQFYANLCLSLLISALLLRNMLNTSLFLILLILSISCLISSILAYRKTYESIKDRIDKINMIKGESK